MKSSSAKGTNKALWYNYIKILKIQHPNDPYRTVIAVKVNLIHIKDLGGKGRRYAPRTLTLLLLILMITANRKKFVFYEELM